MPAGNWAYMAARQPYPPRCKPACCPALAGQFHTTQKLVGLRPRKPSLLSSNDTFHQACISQPNPGPQHNIAIGRFTYHGKQFPLYRQCCRWLLARSEEHTSELQSLMRNSYAVFCLKKKKQTTAQHTH